MPRTRSNTTPRAPRGRISSARVLVVLLCVAAVGWVGTKAVSALVTTPTAPGASVFAAYVDVTVTPSYPFETPAGPAQSTVLLSFVVADPADACAPSWGGYYSLAAAAAELELDRRISQLRITGGDVAVSFGGARGTELASACTDPQDLRAAYRSVVERYDLTTIDLDIEGPMLDDEAAAVRRAEAIKDVQDEAVAAGRGLAVWLTLPVGPDGLTASGRAALTGMLAAGVDVAGVNGMTMDFGVVTTADAPLSDVVLRSATALREQISTVYADAGQPLGLTESWAKVGITPMIGQSDVPTERFTPADAAVVNAFAREHGVGLVAMWSLNRDATCGPPLPSVLTVVQTMCSGVDQAGVSFAEILSADLGQATGTPAPSAPSTPSTASPEPTAAPGDAVDDPATSPYPVWDPLGTYLGGTKIVWQREVYQARHWTSGVEPGGVVAGAEDPWSLIGPVLPGDTPAPLPTVPAGTYPEWDRDEAYVAGTRVLVDLVPYEAKWWSQGQEPGRAVAGGSPWLLVLPGS